MRCCVPFCESSTEDVSPSTTKEISFYSFPRSPPELASWLRALGTQGPVPACAAVCSRHFLPEDMCGLRAGAVPATVQVCMICLDTDSIMFSMSNYNLEAAYEHLTGYPLFDIGNRKHTLCIECAQRLRNFEKFRDKSLRARALMMDLVAQNQVITIRDIVALRSQKSALAQRTCDPQVLQVSADEQAEVKRESDAQMAWDGADAQAEVQSGLAQRTCDPDVVQVSADTQPENSGDGAAELLRDPKLLDEALCRVLLTRMSREEECSEHARSQTTLAALGKPDKAAPEPDAPPTGTRTAMCSSDSDTENDDISSKGFHCQTTSQDQLSKARSPSLKSYIGEIHYICDICQRRFQHKNLLVKHIMSHAEVKRFSCQLCQYKCKYNSEILKHMRTHTGIKSFACKLCSYKFYENGHLLRHMRTHTGEKPFVCKLCQYKCADNNNLVQHMRTHTGEKPFACKLCSYKCISNSNLLRHMRTHTGEKPYACNLCHYRCSQNSTLISHMRTHTGEKPFSCKLCSFKCINNSSLLRHMRTHTGEKPFACKLCSYKCRQNGGLVRHMRTHTVEKPFACKLCSYKCRKNNSLVRHMRTHTGEKPFASK